MRVWGTPPSHCLVSRELETNTVRSFDCGEDARTHEPRAVLDTSTRKSVSILDFKPKIGANNWVSCIDCDEYDMWMVHRDDLCSRLWIDAVN